MNTQPLRARVRVPIASAPQFTTVILWSVLAIAAVGVAVSGPIGFQGLDAVRYLDAAAAWRDAWPDGVVGLNHWAMRLPYVWLLAVIGESEAALLAAHLGFALAVIVASWWFGRRALGGGAAFALCAIVALTPAFVTMAATPNVDIVETALAVAAFWLCLSAAQANSTREGVIAGTLIGIAIVIRQTAVAPALLGGLILLRGRPRRNVAMLAFCCAAALPSMIEAAAYAVAAGDPFHRLSVDLGHARIPSAHLRGGVYTGGVPLLNAELASRWEMPSLVRLHWTIDPYLRLLFHPASTMLLGASMVAGAWLMLGRTRHAVTPRACTVMRWAALGAVLVYITNVFVLSLSPSPRYFGLLLYFLAIPLAVAADLLVHGAAAAGLAAVLLIAAGGAAAQSLQASSAIPARALHEAIGRTGDLVYARGYVVDAARLRLRRDGAAARAIAQDTVPVHGWWLQDGRGALPLGAVCEDGSSRWQLHATWDPEPGLVWRTIGDSRITMLLPAAAEARLRGDASAATLYRRLC